MTSLFTSPDAWAGGVYEISMEYRLLGSAIAAFKELWACPSLEGCFDDREREPRDQKKLSPDSVSPENKIYGVATLPNLKKVPCLSLLFDFNGASKWLQFFLPVSSLASAYLVGAFPFGDWSPDLKWQKEINAWLVDIGAHVFQKVPFEIALVGFEVELTDGSREKIQREGVPEERFDGLLLPGAAGLQFYPQTTPLFKIGQGRSPKNN